MTLPAHHRPDGGFRNPWPGFEAHGLGALARWLLVERVTRGRPKDPPPTVFPRAMPRVLRPRATGDALAITWIGHSTALIQLGGVNVLTDPVWSARASPVPFFGPRRWVAPALPLAELPPIDVVLLSHDHYDHLDDRTVRALARRFPEARWHAPLGVGALLRQRGARWVEDADWWQEVRHGAVRLACTPAQHFSSRGLHDRNRTLWAGWVVANDTRRVFFAGDTALHPEFGAIARRYGPFDAALLPIGAYEPRWFMRAVHMNAEEAVRAYAALRAAAPSTRRTAMVPIHWGTFKLTDEPMDEPPARLRAAWQAAGLDPVDLWLLAHGETRALSVGDIERVTAAPARGH